LNDRLETTCHRKDEMKRIGYIALAAAAILVPLVAIAEGPHREPERDFGSRGRLLLVLRMADELGLSDEKALAVSRVLKDAEAKRDELHAKRRELEKQIRDALAQKKDDAALGKLIDQAVDLDRQRAKEMEDSFTSLKKILTVQEQAKLVLMRMGMHHEPGPHGPGGWREGGNWHHGPGGGPEEDHGPGDHRPPPPPPGPEDEG
jgi:uncharacterized membrane protein